MTLSIVIPSLNSPLIGHVVGAVEAQDRAEVIDEIVVVGRDEARLVPANGRVRYIDTGRPLTAGQARNIGIEETRAESLLFLDSDCIPLPGWLAQHLAARAAGYPVVGGGVLSDGASYFQLVYNLAHFNHFLSDSPAGPRNHLPTLNLAVARQVIRTVGVFDEAVDRVEDLEWTTRMWHAGIQPYFWPQAAVRHQHHRTTFGSLLRDTAYTGHHSRRLRLRHPHMFHPPEVLRHRRLVLWLSPLAAAWSILLMVGREPLTFLRLWHTLPALYLSKIGWCWGASRRRETP